ncbi:MAG: VOC family protein [Candidatus Viridilinea halotolerans]|uniref:VOC family protein n=1 Tax=Candidatus Viridilinea halotolerans TaxID=2491704 RepID=A0A426U8G7_9CHLR|nr:MAG: VOC family protein [Candidatus Viridilinea halotolerans]
MTTHTQPKPAGTPTWVELMTPDLNAAREFYHAVFGWEYDIGAPEYGGYTNARIGGRVAAGLSGPMPDGPPAPSAWSLYFATTAIESDVARAVALGAKLHVPPMSVAPFGCMAVLEDPTGAPFGFWQAQEHIGSQVNDEPGGAAWYELYSPNVPHARDFYCALLGVTAEPMPDDPAYYVFKRGEEQLCAVMQADPAWWTLPPQWITYFGVADADAAVAAVTANGGKALGAIEPTPFGRIATLSDPAGAQFKIVEVPAN